MNYLAISLYSTKQISVSLKIKVKDEWLYDDYVSIVPKETSSLNVVKYNA